MTFDDDQFVKNDKKVFNSNFVQTEAFLSFEYPEPRPIGEVLSMIKIADVDDEEDQATTLESIRSAESITGGRLDTPEVNKALIQKQGSKIQNLMESNSRISSDVLENALKDKEQEKKIVERRTSEQMRLNQLKKKQEVK